MAAGTVSTTTLVTLTAAIDCTTTQNLGYIAIWSRGRFNGQLGLGTGAKTTGQLDGACSSSAGLTNTDAGVTDDAAAPGATGAGTAAWRGDNSSFRNCMNWSDNRSATDNRNGLIFNINHTEQDVTTPFDETKGRYAIFATNSVRIPLSRSCDQEVLTLCIAFDK